MAETAVGWERRVGGWECSADRRAGHASRRNRVSFDVNIRGVCVYSTVQHCTLMHFTRVARSNLLPILMLTIAPFAEEQEASIWENCEPAADLDLCYDQRATNEPLSVEEHEMLSCMDLSVDWHEDTEEEPHVNDTTTPVELLMYLQSEEAVTGDPGLPEIQPMAYTPGSHKRPRVQWSKDEDARLIAFHETHGPRWRSMSRELGSRSDDAYRNRFLRINGQLGGVDESDDSCSSSSSSSSFSRNTVETYKKRLKRRVWTIEEDTAIFSFIGSGQDPSSLTRWSELAPLLHNRSPHAIRNRAYRLTEGIKRGNYVPKLTV